MPYADRMQKALTRRAGDWISRHNWPRVILLLAFAAGVVAAYASSKPLVAIGIHGMALRFAICFLTGYAVYVLLVGFWFWRAPPIDSTTLLQGAPECAETKAPGDDGLIDWERQIGEAIHQSDVPQDQGGVVALLLIAAALGLLIVAFHWVRFAPWYLGEILVLGGKVRHRAMRQWVSPPGLTAPLRQTFWIAMVLMVHYAAIGGTLQLMFPQATTIADIAPPAR